MSKPIVFDIKLFAVILAVPILGVALLVGGFFIAAYEPKPIPIRMGMTYDQVATACKSQGGSMDGAACKDAKVTQELSFGCNTRALALLYFNSTNQLDGVEWVFQRPNSNLALICATTAEQFVSKGSLLQHRVDGATFYTHTNGVYAVAYDAPGQVTILHSSLERAAGNSL